MLLAVYLGAVAIVFAAVSWWALRVRKVDVKNWAGALVLGLWLAGVGLKALVDAVGDDAGPKAALEAHMKRAPGTNESLVWPVAPEATAAQRPSATQGSTSASSAAPSASAAPAGGKPVASSVESLIAPLEARLAAQPGDAKGWALLAQSYVFVGNDAAAERAIAKAVDLGADENDLRARVDAVRRARVHAGLLGAAAGG